MSINVVDQANAANHYTTPPPLNIRIYKQNLLMCGRIPLLFLVLTRQRRWVCTDVRRPFFTSERWSSNNDRERNRQKPTEPPVRGGVVLFSWCSLFTRKNLFCRSL